MEEIEECCICLEDLVTNIAVLNCKHFYHFQCIQQWFQKKKKIICPLCQRDSEIMNILHYEEENSEVNDEVDVLLPVKKVVQSPQSSGTFGQPATILTRCCIIL